MVFQVMKLERYPSEVSWFDGTSNTVLTGAGFINSGQGEFGLNTPWALVLSDRYLFCWATH